MTDATLARQAGDGHGESRASAPAAADASDDPAGGGTPSSTRSTPRASPTATATGPATSPASARGCRTCATSASTRSGSRPGTSSPLADGGYDVADYRAIDPAFGTLAEAEALIAEALELGIRTIVDVVPNHVSDRHPWFQAALAAEPGLARARRGSGSAPAAAPTATSPRPTGCRTSQGTTWTPDDEPGRHARRVVPPPVRGRAAGPQLGPPRRPARARGRSSASGSTAAPPASGSTRRRCWSRTRRCPRSRTRPAPGEHPNTRPRRAPRHLPRLARGRRPLRRRRGCWSARSGSPTSSGSPGTSGRTSSTPPSTSTSWPGRGTPASLRESIDVTLAAHAPVGAPATWVLSNHDVTRPVTRYGREDSSFAFARKRSGPPPTSPSGGAGPRAAALLAAALPGSLYIYQGDELGLDEVEDLPARPRSRTRCTSAPAASTRAATAAACRCPGRGDEPAVRLQPGRRVGRAVAHAARRLGAADRRGPGGATRIRCSRCTVPRSGSGGPKPTSATAPSPGFRRDRNVLAFARGA